MFDISGALCACSLDPAGGVSHDVIDLIADQLFQTSTPSLIACAACCHSLRTALAPLCTTAERRHVEVAALCRKVDRRLDARRVQSQARRPLGEARAADFLRPRDPHQDVEWVSGRLHLPWVALDSSASASDDERRRSAGPLWREAGLDAADAATAAGAFERSPDLFRLTETIDFSSNPLIGDAGVGSLMPILRQMPRLQHLELAGCGLSDAAAVAIATALAPEGRGADRRTKSGAACPAAAAAPSLLSAEATGLRRLGLGSNPIGDIGAAALARALARLPCLKVLQLGDTEVADAGAAALVSALDEGSALQLMQLWLAATRITSAGRASLAAAEMRRHERAVTRASGEKPAAVRLRICW